MNVYAFFFPLESGLLHDSPFPRKAPCHCSGACLCLYFLPPAASSTSLRASDRVKVAIAPAPPTFPVMTQFLTICLQATTTWACFTFVPYPQPLPSQLFTLLIQCVPSTMLSWSSSTMHTPSSQPGVPHCDPGCVSPLVLSFWTPRAKVKQPLSVPPGVPGSGIRVIRMIAINTCQVLPV